MAERAHHVRARRRLEETPGNLTSDAHVAALALEYDCTVVSADSDFRRFSAVTHLNPLAD